MSAPGTVGGLHLSDDAKKRVKDRMQRADEGDVKRQIVGMSALRMCGAILGILFLAVNSYQATWALMKLSGAAGAGEGIYGGGGLSADQWTVGATAFGLILAAQVVAIRMAMAEGGMRFAGFVILIGLMSFSVVTSAMHVAFNVEGGVIASTKATDEYKLAKSRYEAAIASKTKAEESWSQYQNDMRGGDPWSLNATHSKGPARPYVEGISSAKSEIEAARTAFEAVKKDGGGSAMGSVVNTLAKWFGLDSADFAMRFALFAVILMELVRVYLSYLTGRYIMEAMREMSGSDKGSEAGNATAKKPETRAERVMPAAAPSPRDTIRGPVISDPIEVEDKPKPRPLFAPRKPKPEPKTETTEQAPERKKSAKDRAPGNKRNAKFSQQLSKLKGAIGTSFPAGERMKVQDIKDMVDCNSETANRLRNALAESGVAHWRGKSLFAGSA